MEQSLLYITLRQSALSVVKILARVNIALVNVVLLFRSLPCQVFLLFVQNPQVVFRCKYYMIIAWSVGVSCFILIAHEALIFLYVALLFLKYYVFVLLCCSSQGDPSNSRLDNFKFRQLVLFISVSLEKKTDLNTFSLLIKK